LEKYLLESSYVPQNRQNIFAEMKAKNFSLSLKHHVAKPVSRLVDFEGDAAIRQSTWSQYNSDVRTLCSVINAAKVTPVRLIGRGKFSAVFGVEIDGLKGLSAMKVAQYKGNEVSEGYFRLLDSSRDGTQEKSKIPPVACVEEFYREVSALSLLAKPVQHNTIIALKGCLTTSLAIALEFVDGDNLHDYLKKVLLLFYLLTIYI
jgi:serine/threonine protein kinase